MSRHIPLDDYRQTLERARRRARIDEAQTNEAEVEALTQAAATLSPPQDLHPAAAAVADRQLAQLKARVDALDAGDLRFRAEADDLWEDVQDYAFRSGASTTPQRPQVIARFAGGAPEPTLRDLAVRNDRAPGSGERRARLPGAHTLARFTLRDLLDRPPARSAFHRQRQTQSLLMATTLLDAEAEEGDRNPVPPATSVPPPKTGSTRPGSGSGASGQGVAPSRGAEPPAVQPPPPVASPEEDEAGDIAIKTAAAEELERRVAEPIADVIARALPDIDPQEREALGAGFEAAGVSTRGQAALLMADRSLARESGDALRIGVGAALGLDRDETLVRLPRRQAFQAIARAVRLDAETA